MYQNWKNSNAKKSCRFSKLAPDLLNQEHGLLNQMQDLVNGAQDFVNLALNLVNWLHYLAKSSSLFTKIEALDLVNWVHTLLNRAHDLRNRSIE